MTDGVQITWNPWRNHNELLDVRSWFFPDQSSDKDKLRRKACDQVQRLNSTIRNTCLASLVDICLETTRQLAPRSRVDMASHRSGLDRQNAC